MEKKGAGSNPALGSKRSIRSSARMPPCHGGEAGSIPAWTAKVSFPTSGISEKLKGEQKRYTSPRLTLFAAIV